MNRIRELFDQVRSKLRGMNIRGTSARISQSEALDIATRYCRDNQLPWHEPAHVVQARGNYTVWTNFGARGNNRWVRIDAHSGTIRGSGVTSR